MNISVTEFAAATRVTLLDAGTMPHDRVSSYKARRDLTTRDYGVWTILRHHLWMCGSLPVEPRALAKIAGVGVASFQRAAPQLGSHFDRAVDGSWTDHLLLQQRFAARIAAQGRLAV